jgi:UDP-N-acetylmuramoyl-tripeptide--D-alanyl-D-alanine ligase
MAEKTPARVFFYGLSRRADLWADDIEGLGLEGIRLRLHYRGETLTVKVPLLGRHSAHTVLRSAAVGLVEGLTWGEIVSGLRMGHTQLRLVAVRAASGALLLDDTYNASPQSTLAALNLLADLPGRRVAVLGDMLELGPYEHESHRKVGLRAAEVVSLLVTVGARARIIAAAAREAGLPPARVLETETAAEAVDVLRAVLRPDDVVLVKGSRGVKMDRIVGALETMA